MWEKCSLLFYPSLVWEHQQKCLYADTRYSHVNGIVTEIMPNGGLENQIWGYIFPWPQGCVVDGGRT